MKNVFKRKTIFEMPGLYLILSQVDKSGRRLSRVLSRTRDHHYVPRANAGHRSRMNTLRCAAAVIASSISQPEEARRSCGLRLAGH